VNGGAVDFRPPKLHLPGRLWAFFEDWARAFRASLAGQGRGGRVA
jgi:hypothetical protein